LKLIDLNVLLYAVNEDTHHHQRVRAWWESQLGEDEPIALAWVVVLGFLRLATNPSLFDRPLTAEQAIDCVDRWLRHPNIRLVTETREHWSTLRELLAEAGTAGNLTTDAHLAALAITHGATLATCDNDFARFPALRRVDPRA